MIVWLWDACGPARTGRGITDDRARAVRIAETYLRTGQATVATVEGARLLSGIRTLTTGYQRTGEGWRARCGGSGICWEQFAPARAEAS
ncbi:hypothetical protein [Trebonia sp.]|uniref:hypothetical protein n=1 Tax=Trebonia sp. TaxID=2767075 RepID=UPI002613950B|nr:hypothetical protein [Trebonia sp.]